MLNTWSDIIKRDDKIMTNKDVVCSLHFNDNDIITTFSQKLKNGKIFTLERQVPKLKETAVPSKFLPSLSTLENTNLIQNIENICSVEEFNMEFSYSTVDQHGLIYEYSIMALNRCNLLGCRHNCLGNPIFSP